jgi:hypothetical protein
VWLTPCATEVPNRNNFTPIGLILWNGWTVLNWIA